MPKVKKPIVADAKARSRVRRLLKAHLEAERGVWMFETKKFKAAIAEAKIDLLLSIWTSLLSRKARIPK